MEYEIKPKSKFSIGLQELWEFRELLFFFTWRDIKVKYKQAALGIGWAILQPFLLMLLFSFIFSRGIKLSESSLPYPLFTFSGLVIWYLFSGSVSQAANSMVANAHIIKKIYFPRLIIPLSAIVSALFDSFFAFLTVFALVFYFGVEINFAKLFIVLPISVFLTILSAIGFGTLLAALNSHYRDFQYLLPFIIQVLFFISPVFYSYESVDLGEFGSLLEFNPMAGAIHLFRSAFTGEPIEWDIIFRGYLCALILFVLGVYVFRKMEAHLADIV